MPWVLPSPPETLLKVVRLAGDDGISAEDLGRVIERDASFTVALLRLANSAAYGIGRPVRTVQQAGVLLGTRCVRSMALAQAVRVATAEADLGDLDPVAFWEGSLRRGVAARMLAERAGFEDPTEAFTLGLIQDIGLLEMAARWKDRSAAVQETTTLPDPEFLEAERQITGLTHPELFCEAGESWGLPDDIVHVVASHHAGPDFTPDHTEDRRLQRLVEICRAADVVARVVQSDAAGASVVTAEESIAALRSRTVLSLQRLIDDIGAEMAHHAEELGIRIGDQPTLASLLASVARSLSRLNLSYEQLTRRLRQALQEKEDLARRLERSNAALHRLAATDALTEAANRRAFVAALEAALRAAAESGRPVSLLMMDVDRFKQINDTHGHSAGDDVLRCICRRFEENVRNDDVVGRLGGEEFAVLLANCPDGRAKAVAERLRRVLAAEPIVTADGVAVRVTASFGGATVVDDPDVGADELLRRCDRALYASKGAGRDRVTWAS